MSVLAVSLGAGFGAGVVLVIWGFRPRPIGPSRPSWTRAFGGWRPPSPGRATVVTAAGLGVLVVTRWPVLAVAAAAAAWWFSNRDARSDRVTIERTEAIATWAEMLRDATGTARGIEGVLISTAQTAPLPIRHHVVRFAHQLTYEPVETALPDLAADLDDANGDLIVAALSLAAGSGGRDLRAVLDDLAGSARDEARIRRRLEVSRERPRSDMRQVVGIIVCVIALLALYARDYLQPYDSAGGQIVLAFAAALWIGGFLRMAQLGRVAPAARFLTTRREPT